MLKELMNRPLTIEALQDAASGRVDLQVMIGALHRAVLAALKDEPAFEEPSYSQEEAEAQLQETLRTATAIYAVAVNWPERDGYDENPALSAVLDAIEYEGNRTITLKRELRL